MENNANNIDATIIDTGYDAKPINPTIPIGIDLSKYISEDEIMSIVRRIYEEEARNYAKQRLAFMSSNGISIVQMIIKEVANKYAEELAPQYHKRFLEICQYEIEKTESNREDYNDTVHYAFNTSLISLASKYVNENKDELIGLIKDQINECAKTLSLEKISRLIATSVETEIKKFLSGNDNSDNRS